jgi:hypothetical protein
MDGIDSHELLTLDVLPHYEIGNILRSICAMHSMKNMVFPPINIAKNVSKRKLSVV